MILIASPELDKLIGEGKVKDRTDVSRTGIALAVRKGAPHPDVSTPDALKRALLAAKSIGHTAPAGGGITALHIQRVFERLGIAEQVTPKVKLAAGGPNGRVSVLVASGEAEIGLQQVSELMSNPDVEVIGMLPDELQQITINSAGITAIAKEPDAARALIKQLTSPEALAIYKTKGLKRASRKPILRIAKSVRFLISVFCTATVRQRPSSLRTTRMPTPSRATPCRPPRHRRTRESANAPSRHPARGCGHASPAFRASSSERPAGAVQPLHQVEKFGAGLHPDAVDGDELAVVGQRLDHAVRIVAVPGVVEARLDLPDRASRPRHRHLNAPFLSSASHFAISLLRCAASFSGGPPMKR